MAILGAWLPLGRESGFRVEDRALKMFLTDTVDFDHNVLGSSRGASAQLAVMAGDSPGGIRTKDLRARGVG